MTTAVMLYSDVSAFTNTVWEAALEIARAENKLAPTVTNFSDLTTDAPRSVTIWGTAGAFRQVAETDDLTPTHIPRTQGETLTPYEYADQHVITFKRIRSEAENAKAEAAKSLGYNAALTVDQKIISDFASLTGGTIGAAGTVITWGHLYAARAVLEGSNIRGPYTAVVHPFQMFALQKSLSVAGLTLTAVPQSGDLSRPFSFMQVGDISVIASNNLTVDTNGDVTGAFYPKEALALDMRQGLTFLPDTDPSRRIVEINATMTFAHGIWRPTYGLKLIFDAATPTS
jgi:hypothetical protein